MGLIMSKDIANLILSTLFHEKECGKLMVSRSGRLLQRYDKEGLRQVVGCVPYRFTKRKSDEFSCVEDLEVLLISSQKSQRMMFPKGGWESDENMEDAALRETIEEAGVVGKIGVSNNNFYSKLYLFYDQRLNFLVIMIFVLIMFIVMYFLLQKILGKWRYLSKRESIVHEGYMFPLLVSEELDLWPEKNLRNRQWVCRNEIILANFML
ncbi:nudix hydrolase 18, mitochondrial isoform X1 [Cannabis sativa]|uniref:nudix hydrolase 18, mitochondrial isoform X1 n=1 Tax=Cannabis sativa TaxID=3483 RepID=UPI0029CA0C20|nr:nudix hydrolase 18, mitochondrial isoform X1 [Cannabis sativa]